MAAEAPYKPKYTYYANQYPGWNDDDSTDDSDAIQAAINAAAVTGGEVVIPCRHGVLNKSGRNALTFPADLTNGIVIRGLGVDVTTIRFGVNTRTFLEPDGVLTGNTHTYGKIEVRDLTIDAKNTSGTARPTWVSGHYGVAFSNAGIRANYDGITYRRVRTKNVGPLLTAGLTSTDGNSLTITQERRNFDLTVGTTPDGINGATAYTIKNILLEDCDFGWSTPYNSGTGAGGGGNYGAVVQGFYGGSDRVANRVYNATWVSNVWLENIVYRRCRWSSGQTPTSSTQPSVSGMSSAGFMIGGNAQGTDWLAEECNVKYAGDTNYEFDSGIRMRLVRCTSEDGWNVGYYFANIGGGADTYGYANPEQHLRLDGCTAKRVTSTNMQNLLVHQPKFGTPHGTITVNDFTSVTNQTFLPSAGQNSVEFRGDIGKLTITNLRINSRITTSAAAGSFVDRGLNIALRGGRSHVVVDGLYDDVQFTGSGGGSYERPVYSIHVADGVIDISNVVRKHRFFLSGGTTANSKDGIFFQTGGQSFPDPFGAGTSSLSRDYIDVTGTGLADITQSGTLNTPLNVTVEKRFLWLMASGNGSWQNTGPWTDGCISIKSTPGPTLTSHKTGVILKADPRDATTYLECYVSDDGANSTLLIDKILAGVRTNLVTSSSLATRISNGTDYWVRGKISGNVVTADYFTSAPSAVATAGATTVTSTLTSTDIYKLGEQMQGRCGFSWVPQDSAATLDDLKIDWCQVVRGQLHGHTPGIVAGPAAVAYGLDFQQKAGTWRFPGVLKVHDNDWTALEGNTSIAELNQANDSTILYSLLATENAYASPPAAAAITPSGSPYTYQNIKSQRQRVGIYGGTVSAVSITDRSGTTTQVGGGTNTSVTLGPGESVVVTYTVAPTMNQVPVR